MTFGLALPTGQRYLARNIRPGSCKFIIPESTKHRTEVLLEAAESSPGASKFEYVMQVDRSVRHSQYGREGEWGSGNGPALAEPRDRDRLAWVA
jgi:hypothetical protein